jgi:GTP-binding protein
MAGDQIGLPHFFLIPMRAEGMFRDEAVLRVCAGKGGDGCSSFHREKYVTRGGPDGGDGGRGGDVVFEVTHDESSLFRLARQREYRAKNGQSGGANNCSGASGDSIYLKVPVGTQVRDANRGNLLADLTQAGESVVIAAGGKGGKGNARFASATRQSPERFDKGKLGEKRELMLELKLVADVGLIGLPNAGKSTLQRKLTSARPRIGAYPFTTLDPNLGMMETGREPPTLVLADIPGLIEGASQGKGLGLQFLRHVERTRVLIHLVDCSVEGKNPFEDFQTIRKEIEAYSQELGQRDWLLLATKVEDEDSLAKASTLFKQADVTGLAISAATGEGVEPLRGKIFDLVQNAGLAK